MATYNQDLFELRGQSNAEGAAYNNQLPADLQGALADCKIYTATSGGWANVQAGVNNRTEPGNTAHHGIEIRFLKAMKAATGRTPYLMKWGRNSTQIAPHATEEDWHPTSSGELFSKANANHTAAKAALGNSLPPKAMIWIQWENDALEPRGSAYKSNLKAMIEAYRTFCGAPVAIILVAPSDMQTYYTEPLRTTIKNAQLAVQAELPKIYIINSDGLGTSDTLHFGTASIDTIATRAVTVIQSIPEDAVEAEEPIILKRGGVILA